MVNMASALCPEEYLSRTSPSVLVDGQVLMSVGQECGAHGCGLWSRTACVQNPAPVLTGDTNLSKLPNMVVPQFPHVENVDIVGLSESLCVRS